ncbi:MAG: zinc-ribbon and FHA domain-containing protein [Myxococcales bacterium]|nr:zinc-ribbon and FHA domain-containing protein [Myxococcales bacterium]
MINCSNCGKENQDHYKFCLGCGARLAASARPAPAIVPAATPAAPAKGGTVVAPSQAKGGTVVTPSQPASAPAAAAKGGTVVTPSQPAAAAAPVIGPPRGSTHVGASQNNAPPLVTATSAGLEPSQPRTGGTVVGGSGSQAREPSAAQHPLEATSVLKVGSAPPMVAPAESASASCSSCGMVNPPGFAFCGRCGSRLAAPPPTAQPSAPPVAAPVAPAPAPAPAPVAPPRPGLRASLHLLREDGSEGGTLHLEDGPVPFGRDYGPPFDGDFYLNPQHCAFTVMPEGVRVDDLSTTNGVFRKIEGTIELQHGDTFRVGQELLYYEDLPEPEVLADGTERMGSPNPGYWGRISVLVEVGRACEAQPIVGAEFTVGRERGDLTFPSDGYVSSAHCRVVADDSGVYLEDRGSSNGTYLRVRSGTVVPYGSLVLIGQQLFHIKPA